MGHAPVPYEVIIAFMCEKFNKLPSEIEEEPADSLLMTWQILNKYQEAVEKKRSGRKKS